MPVTVPVSMRPTGTALSRFLMAKAATTTLSDAIELAGTWRDTPQVRAALEAEYTKAAVPPGMVSDPASWAAPIANFGIASEVLTLLRDASILGRLEGQLRRVPFRTSVVRETGSGTSGAWIGEGLATPMQQTAFDSVAQEVYKAGVFTVLTKELVHEKLGHPMAEAVVRQTLVGGLAAFFDAQFLLPAVTLLPGLRPASITNGATAVTSTGTTAAQMNADLAALLAAVTTPGPLVWVMRPVTAYKIAATLGGTTTVDIPRTLFGIPLVLSKTSPPQITLLDPAQVLYSDDGGIELSTTDQATLQMDDAPDSPATASTIVTDLWRVNYWAIKAMRYVAWLRALDGAVAYMEVSY